ncbi:MULTISPECIES: succinylglutamate desuccinylase/aspartoacylase family protein [unclassified Herbaspirillum]|uniref:succinylglutamate desuccinylase/aspartoacylase domain-containing protein n=1 Tax=unclassified Herbaspirillum TaxID=2624150 RepID=UPI001153FAFA|nr:MULTISPECIES: succinylglutamate desuccinylase/aspartoacylase family protein [unclassified Herbaspirillum]MBB5393349.1 putative deacylase [Herbaspirillum sp. SJZ102]TQK03902.1 putative deacylase [Herbaspirillum sp. SJZ130]TQK08634.1 putative deacylase [Herbaspirillum sp. SJZ106]TWC71905.1 putative deacylase [Herbaspirillum sp. SJZ099]
MISSSIPSTLQRHQFAALEPGPHLLVLGAVHGNETCGTRAIERLLRELDSGDLAIARGLLTLVPVTNPLAYRNQQRQGERNLNRNMRINPAPANFEDRISNLLCPWIAEHDVLLDLHSFHTAGVPFAMLGPEDNDGDIEPFAHAQAEQRMAAHLGTTRIVEGWMATYARGVERRRQEGKVSAPDLLDRNYGVGTTEFARTQGAYGITLECGQHDDPRAPEVAYQAIRQTLALLDMIDVPLEPPRENIEIIRLVDVIDMEHPDDAFTREWASFDRVTKGQTIGHRHGGAAVTAPDDGYIVFPNPKALSGNEWFYFGVKSGRQL